MSKNIFKNSFSAKRFFNKKQENNGEEMEWLLIEISPECKILIYKYCIGEFSEIIKDKYPEAVLFNRRNKLFAEAVREADILLGWRFPEELLQKAESLKWIQLISVGLSLTDQEQGILEKINHDMVITNTKGLYSEAVANYVIWSILTLSRKFHFILSNQRLKNWAQHIGADTRGKMAGILGLGETGKAVAQKVKAIGMKVSAIKRNYSSNCDIPNLDRLYPLTKFAEFLNNVDFLVICLPLTSETKGLIDKNKFKQMKDSAFIIDVSRGGIVNYKDLIWAVESKIISGAALDVFEDEPLPKDSKLWDLSNVIVTPHIGGLTSEYSYKVGDFFCDNLKRFIENRDLINVMDKFKGY